MWGVWRSFEIRVVPVNCSADSPEEVRSPRHLPDSWIVLGKNTLHVTHPAVSPSLMFSMVQWGLCHMAKLVLHKAVLCTPDLGIKILKFG
jgi:hypothetical protein